MSSVALVEREIFQFKPNDVHDHGYFGTDGNFYLVA